MFCSYAFESVKRDVELVINVLSGTQSHCTTAAIGRRMHGGTENSFVQRCAFLVHKPHLLSVFVVAPRLSLYIDAKGVRHVSPDTDALLYINEHAFKVRWYTEHEVRHAVVLSGPHVERGYLIGSGWHREERSFVLLTE